MSAPTPDAYPGADAFVEQFAAAWAYPDLDQHQAMWHPDVRLIQPMSKIMTGHAECREQFAAIFKLLPDLRAEVRRWAARDDDVFIEIVLRATLAGRPVEWAAVDRVRLVDGLIAERMSYFDSLPLVTEILKRPRAWGSSIRSGIWPRPTLRQRT